MAPGPCYRCGQYGHFAADCPELKPPGTRVEHERRIAVYVQRFFNHLENTPGVQWTLQQKTRAIEAENKMRRDELAETTRKG